MLEVGGDGVFCGRGHLQTRKTNGNQGKLKKPKVNQGKIKYPKENMGIQGEIRNHGETIGRGNKGIFMVRESYVYEGMSMYWWCVFLWVMEGV